MIRSLYTLSFYILLPIILFRLLWRSIRSPQYRRRWSERFGFVACSQKNTLWLHSVSVGETIASEPLVRALLKRYPNDTLWITTTTPTGSHQVVSLYKHEIADGRVLHSYLPYDVPDCVHRFIKRVQPKIALFIETELWPNIINICAKKKIPTLLINARLSERSFTGYQRIRCLSHDMFSQLTLVVAQTESDAQRIQSLQAKSVLVSGSLKSEVLIDEALQQRAQDLKQQWSLNGQRQIIIAASTHQGEDGLILSAYQQCLEKNQSLILVLVPRHPERFRAVEQLCQSQGFHVQLRSRHETINANTQVIVGDTMGELMLMYGASDVAIVGGSFVERGGHNVLEPAAWGLPIITGDYVFNFSKIVDDMKKQKAIVVVNQQHTLMDSLHHILDNPHSARQLGEQAKAYVNQSRGALSKTLHIIDKQLTK